MSPIVFLSMFLSSSLILISIFILFLYLLLHDFWFYNILIVSLFMLNYSFNIMHIIENLEKEKKVVNTLLDRNRNGNIIQVRRSTRIQKKKEREAAEALLELSKRKYI